MTATDWLFLVSFVAFVIVLVCYVLALDESRAYRAMWAQAEDDLLKSEAELAEADTALDIYEEFLGVELPGLLHSTLAATEKRVEERVRAELA